jgi:hypothetical protein
VDVVDFAALPFEILVEQLFAGMGVIELIAEPVSTLL